MKIDDLVVCLEAADSGSRGLDGRIFIVLGNDPYEWAERENYKRSLKEIVEREGYDSISEVGWDHWGVPYYTTSLDAALSLVPRRRGGNVAGFLYAAMFQLSIGDIPDNKLALTVCIRALKARARSSDG